MKCVNKFPIKEENKTNYVKRSECLVYFYAFELKKKIHSFEIIIITYYAQNVYKHLYITNIILKSYQERHRNFYYRFRYHKKNCYV